MGNFWKFKNTATAGAVELLLYGEIKSEKSWLDELDDNGGIYSNEFVADLQAMGSISQITCRINSPGGDIFAAVAIYTQLKTHTARIVCIVDGLAASAATLIMMAADEIQMPNGAMVMIHDPMAVLTGAYKSDELNKQAAALETIKDSIVGIYAERTKLSKAKLIDFMSMETWWTADEAIKNGFCDTIVGSLEASMSGSTLFVNKVEHDLSKFKNVPSVTKAKAKDDEEIDDDDAADENEEDDDEVKDKKAKKAKKAVKNFTNKYPNLVNLIIARAISEERKRIQSIDAISNQLNPELTYKAKYTTLQDAKDILYENALQSQGKRGFLGSFQGQTDAALRVAIGKRIAAHANKDLGHGTSGQFQDTSFTEASREAMGAKIAEYANKKISGR